MLPLTPEMQWLFEDVQPGVVITVFDLPTGALAATEGIPGIADD